MRSIGIIFAIFSFMTSVYAVNSEKCSKLLNAGYWKVYKYQGIGEYGINAVTKGTKQDGSTVASSEGSTTEPTTASFDPVYSSNVSTSQTQSSSSWGECSMFAASEALLEQRDLYITQNRDEIESEIARGEGEHLKVLTYFSACRQEVYLDLAKEIQAKLVDILEQKDSNEISKIIDSIIINGQRFKINCASRKA